MTKTGEEVWNLNGTRRVPYRLPELIKAVEEDADVWLCKGEKDANNLGCSDLRHNFKNWKREFNELSENLARLFNPRPRQSRRKTSKGRAQNPIRQRGISQEH